MAIHVLQIHEPVGFLESEYNINCFGLGNKPNFD